MMGWVSGDYGVDVRVFPSGVIASRSLSIDISGKVYLRRLVLQWIPRTRFIPEISVVAESHEGNFGNVDFKPLEGPQVVRVAFERLREFKAKQAARTWVDA